MSDRKKILVVDDENDCLEFVKSILEPEDFDIITAMNGQEGVEKTVSEQPHLVILDVQMPVRDGFQAFSDIKRCEATKDIPVIMLTGIRDKIGIGFSVDEMQKFMGTQPDEYLEKPVDPEKLKEIVKKVLEMN